MALDVTISILLLVSSLIWRGSATRECSDTWILGAALDIPASKVNNASVSFTRIYLAKNTTQCSNDCCQQIHGPCDLAVFTETSTKHTCYHYECAPIELCRFKRDNESESYLVSISATENQSLSYLDEVPNPPDTLVVIESTHGDGTRSKPRKGAQPDELPVQDVPLKHDNTTIVPRKGVLPVTNPDQIDDVILNVTNNTRQSFQSVMEGQDTAGVNFPKEKDNKSFSDKIQNDTYDRNFTDLIESNTNTNTTPSATLSTFKSTTTTTNAFKVLPSSTETNIEFHTGQAIMTSGPNKEPLQMEPIGDPDEQLTGNGSVVEVYHTSDVVDDDIMVMRTSYSDIAFRNSGSMHLVVGLVLGLLVLLGVFALVAKRIHDSWLRRHYHRMDFLVDGMYHGEP